nr:hypothetical protein 28 [bacterium]
MIVFFYPQPQPEKGLPMKHAILAGAVAAGLVASPALAAENFKGAYGGIQAGYETFDVDTSETNVFAAGDSISYSLGADGINAGGFVGYGWRDGKAYGGVEVEASIGNADTTVTYSLGGSTASTSIEHNHTIGITGRVGYIPNEETLIYARAGFVRSEFESAGSESLNGVRVGLGAETAMDKRTTLRADWTFTSYEDYSETVGATVTTLEPTASVFRLGIAWAF